MGHGPGSETFLKYYKSQTSTVDIQAMMHDYDGQRDVVRMSSMALGRSEDAPLSLSAKGEDTVMADSRIREADRKCTEMLDSLTERYPSIEAAKRDDSEEFRRWHETNKKYRLLLRQLREAELKKEYDAYCQAKSTLKAPVFGEPDCVDDPVLDKQPMYADCQAKSTLKAPLLCEPDVDDPVLDKQPRYADVDFEPSCRLTVPEGTESATMDINLIDPAILSPEDFAMSAGRAGDDRFTGLSISHHKAEAEAEGEKVVSKDLDTSVHGTYRHHAKQRLAEGSYYESMICQEHRFDNLLDDTSKQPLSDLKLAEKVIPFFKTMHAVERYGKLEPEPSTFICPSCLDGQGSKDDFDHHVVACRTKVVHANAELDWAHDLQPKMAVACTWQSKHTKTCGKNFADLHKFGRHVLSHAYYSKVCKFHPCQSLAKQPQYETLDAWSDHVATDHGLTWLKPAALVFFCAFCNDHVSFGVSGPSQRVKHYFEHLPEAFRSIRQLGYNEVYSTARGTMILNVRNPCFCIFCVHDATLPADVRLAFGNEKTSTNHSAEWRKHLLQHFATIEGLTVPCPASAVAGAESPMCLSTKLYTSQELEQHCLEVHRIFRLKGLSTATLPKPGSRSSKRALEAQAASGIEGAQLGDDNSDGGGGENDQDMTASKPDQTRIARKRQHLAEVTGNPSL